jgi:hypothetical protein
MTLALNATFNAWDWQDLLPFFRLVLEGGTVKLPLLRRELLSKVNRSVEPWEAAVLAVAKKIVAREARLAE